MIGHAPCPVESRRRSARFVPNGRLSHWRKLLLARLSSKPKPSVRSTIYSVTVHYAGGYVPADA
jgi:hypothetical protein